ncbi:hypothetical protein BVF91_11525 [Thermoanaerobacterium sp. PSU-2]|uniref:hypothetical protein n=1 Tax=Thermoanaerobacterium sp. PSU-2 TaxID=1930849 RepID=UPI000A1467FD|nr:hypothetical protein [Thermoanaerobacterium sp. PSU-2]ORX22463.1 hypothetical protein BVF91_11525 [Thermoanaerobacterium sp. PSU-2]
MKLIENIKYTKDGREIREEHELNNWKNIRYYLKDMKNAYVDVKKNTVVLTKSRSYELNKEYHIMSNGADYRVTYTVEE